MLILALAILGAANPVIGAWAAPGSSEPFAVFNADGSCSLEDDPCTWRSDGKTLFITPSQGETEAVPYKTGKGTLAVTVGGVVVELVKPGMAAPAQAAQVAQVVAPAATTAKVDVNDPMAKLLLSSAWCSFHYNQTSGSSSTTRVQWYPDGTYQIGGRSEGYSSGYGGTFSSQHDSGATGKWTVSKSVVMATPPPTADNPMPTAMVVVPMTVTRNSNGFPIVTSMGVEYSQCQ
jgi:hypothetical protein